MKTQTMVPRGVRNNNPLNIEYNAHNNWQGQTGSDGRFSIFVSSDYGFRAGAIVLKNYQRLYGLETLNDIINRFAPPTENDSHNYASFVASQVKIDVNDPINLTSNNELLTDVVHAMSIMEVGRHYTRSDAARGVALA